MNEREFDAAAAFPSVISTSPGVTARIGEILSSRIFSSLLILLNGGLGSGKTLLTQAIGSYLGVQGIRSPTFTMESIYKLPGKSFPLVHSDLYRLDGSCGADAANAAMQMEERLDEGGVVIVEWAERLAGFPVFDRWDIRILLSSESSREIEFAAFGAKAVETLAAAYLEILDIEFAGAE
jgi:tRNA threonylcarbamoyladenosine biosynthesis protein TsaE